MSKDSNNFNISDSAAARIFFLLSQEKKNTKLRISVEGGGCSGFQYKYEMTSAHPDENDVIIIKNGAIVIIDDISIGFLKNSTIDYIKNLTGEYFEIKNPNAVSGCGCGNSFSV